MIILNTQFSEDWLIFIFINLIYSLSSLLPKLATIDLKITSIKSEILIKITNSGIRFLWEELEQYNNTTKPDYAIYPLRQIISILKNNKFDVMYKNNNILSEMASFCLRDGDIAKCEEYLKSVETVMQNPFVFKNLGLYWFIKARLETEKGEYNKALVAINQNIYEDKLINLLDGTFTAPTYIVKAEILNKQSN